MNEDLRTTLLFRAKEISKNAYAPYSKFHVGCAVLLADGRIIEGVNIENASYPVTLCAERAAFAPIITEGSQHLITALAVVVSGKEPGSPCGMCRQFLGEFLHPETPIFLGTVDGASKTLTMSELLPHPFDKSSLIG